MSLVPAVGAMCLGIVIGWLTRYFVFRFNSFKPMTLTAVISAIVGGTVVGFLGADKSVWWFYPIGLLIGFVVYAVVARRAGAPSRGAVYHVSSLPMQDHLEMLMQSIAKRRHRIFSYAYIGGCLVLVAVAVVLYLRRLLE